MKTAEIKLPSIQDILREPSASYWLKRTLEDAIKRDPVDAANDAELLYKLLDKRCADLLN